MSHANEDLKTIKARNSSSGPQLGYLKVTKHRCRRSRTYVQAVNIDGVIFDDQLIGSGSIGLLGGIRIIMAKQHTARVERNV